MAALGQRQAGAGVQAVQIHGQPNRHDRINWQDAALTMLVRSVSE